MIATGVAALAGAAAFYVMRVFLERTPLEPPANPRDAARREMGTGSERGASRPHERRTNPHRGTAH